MGQAEECGKRIRAPVGALFLKTEENFPLLRQVEMEGDDMDMSLEVERQKVGASSFSIKAFINL